MTTGPELFREAERLRERAAEWMDVDYGWRGELSAQERLAYRMADLAEAQVCATLAHAAATAMAAHVGDSGMNYLDAEAWDAVCGVQEDDEDEPCARCGDYGHEAADCEAVLDDGPYIDTEAPFAVQREQLAAVDRRATARRREGDQELAAADAAIAAGAQIDAAVESTGHLPGCDDGNAANSESEA